MQYNTSLHLAVPIIAALGNFIAIVLIHKMPILKHNKVLEKILIVFNVIFIATILTLNIIYAKQNRERLRLFDKMQSERTRSSR